MKTFTTIMLAMNPEVTLRPWRVHHEAVMQLQVAPSQSHLLDPPTVAEFLADDDAHPTFESFAVCDGHTVVGLVCLGQEPAQEQWRWWIPLLVIDFRQQGRGYGRTAMEAVIRRVRGSSPDCRALGLSCKPDNLVAMRLYQKLGFEPVGVNDSGEIDMWLTIDP